MTWDDDVLAGVLASTIQDLTNESPSSFKERGGRAELTGEFGTALRAWRVHAERSVQIVSDIAVRHRGLRPSISVEFYANQELGAASKKIGEHAFAIGISEGTIDHLRASFLPIVETGRALDLVLGTNGDGVQKVRYPVNQDPKANEDLIDILCREALWSIFDHELAHIMNGHLGYIEQSTGIGALADAAGERAPGPNPIMRQTLEMDADSVSVSRGLSRVVAQVDHSGAQSFSALETPRGAIAIWGLSTYAQHRALATTEPILERLEEFSHTPPHLRSFLAFGIFLSCLEARKDGTSGIPWSASVDTILSHRQVLFDSAIVCELALAESRHEPLDPTIVQMALHEEARYLILTRYREAWAKARPHLEPHAYVPLAPVSLERA